jgi:hypothetical protein
VSHAGRGGYPRKSLRIPISWYRAGTDRVSGSGTIAGMNFEVPIRSRRKPLTSTRGRIEQITQPAPPHLQKLLLDMAAALPGVTIGPSSVCVPGSRGCHLDPMLVSGPTQAFFAGAEFGHLHPAYDGSVHLRLPPDLAGRVVGSGWGVATDPSGSVLVYGPQDDTELVTVWLLLLAAYRHAASGRPRVLAREGSTDDADRAHQDGPRAGAVPEAGQEHAVAWEPGLPLPPGAPPEHP